jgi:hypothetical protein
MKMKFSLLSVALGVVALGTVFAPVARAGCGAYPLSSARGGIKPAAFVIGTAAADDWDFRHDSDAPIVGLWRVHFISEGNLKTIGVPDGTVIDQGYAAWHSDGTEIMNSGRDPLTGSFCLGVWKHTGWSTYKLNHFAMNWSGLTSKGGVIVLDPKTGQPVNTLIGPSNIREDVTLDPDRDHFQGTFAIINYNPDGGVLVTITGKITGLRLTADGPGFVP